MPSGKQWIYRAIDLTFSPSKAASSCGMLFHQLRHNATLGVQFPLLVGKHHGFSVRPGDCRGTYYIILFLDQDEMCLIYLKIKCNSIVVVTYDQCSLYIRGWDSS